MTCPAPLSSHPTPHEPFFDMRRDEDTVVQTRKVRRLPTPVEELARTPHVTFLPSPALLAETGPTALVGTTLGDFELLELCGRGGVGAVYKARQKSRDRLLAVKVLHAKHRDDEVCVTRFLNEARAAATLRHPNVIRVHHVGGWEGGYYYAMELIDGPSLEIMVREGDVSLLWIVNTLIRLAETMHHAHSRGIIHRDLKPANILLDGRDRPVIIDFGLVKYLDGPPGLTQPGEVLGTPSYMAPEQADDDPARVGPASDIYALGAILYTLLTRRVPFDAGSGLSTILKVIGPDLPPPVRVIRPEVPEELASACMRCLAKQPAERFATAENLAAELRRVRDTLILGQD